MKRHTIAAALVVSLAAAAQAQTAQGPWPMDDSKLGDFIGSWSVEGDVKAGNSYGAPAGKYTYTEKYSWRPGNLLVNVERNGQGPAGKISHSILLGYHLTTKQYSLIGRDWITGALVNGTGTTKGDSWTFLSIGYLGDGKYFHQRCAMSVTPRSSYSVRCDTSPDGKTWTRAFEGGATRR
jgi:hypothetical protein